MPAPTHSQIGPSKASCWSTCSMSVYLSQLMGDGKAAKTKDAKAYALKRIQQLFPGETAETFFAACASWVPNRESKFAAEGTMAHEWAERILKGTVLLKELPLEFAPVAEYVKLCDVLLNRWQGHRFIESRVPLFYHPDDRGTVDCGIITPDGSRVLITDLKYGAGIPVEAENNLQLAIYALSFIREYGVIYDFTPETIVEIRICQPRMDDSERVWETTVGELEVFTAKIVTVAEDILKVLKGTMPHTLLEFSPSQSNCRFCANKEICGARAQNAMAPVEASLVFEEVVQFGNTLVSPSDIVRIYSKKKEITAILNDAEAWLMERASSGNPVPGTKLVRGRDGNRAWTDPAMAADCLKQELPDESIWEMKVRSPTKVMQELKDNKASKATMDFYTKLINRAPGRPALALESDPRPALEGPEELFDEIHPELDELL